MGDFGVLSAVRKILLADPDIATVTQKIYLTAPPVRSYPAIIIELEEILTFLKRGQGAPLGSVKLKVVNISEQLGPLHALSMAQKVTNCLDGQHFHVTDGLIATARMVGTVMHIPKDERARYAENFFEILIRS